MPTTTSPLTPATHGLRLAASFNQNYDTYVIDHPLPIEVFVGPKNGN